MRLFFGVELPPVVRAAAAAVAADRRRQVERTAPRARIRWIPPDNLHVTVWFLGEVDDARVTAVKGALAEPFEQRAFGLRLAGLGAYPPHGGLRVVWIGVEDGAQALQSLHGELAHRLATLGFAADRRPYSPHLSLARVKDIRPADGTAVRRILGTGTVALGGFDVSALTLFSSRTLPEGSEYQAALRVPLK